MFVRALAVVSAIFLSTSFSFGHNGFGHFILPAEPLIRIGLSTNASSVSITTSDYQLVAYSPEEPGKYLATNRVSVSARAYRPPEVETYRFEIQNIAFRVRMQSRDADREIHRAFRG